MMKEISLKSKWTGALKNRKKNGSIYEEYLKITSLKDNDGKVLNYVATFSSSF